MHSPAKYAFEPSRDHEIALNEGDAVTVFERAAGWYWGCVTGDPDHTGLFPVKYVVLDTQGDNDNAAQASTASLGHASTTAATNKRDEVHTKTRRVLQEWRTTMMQHLQAGRVDEYHELKARYGMVLEWRRQLASSTTSSRDRQIVHENLLRLLQASREMREGQSLTPMTATNEIASALNTDVLTLYVSPPLPPTSHLNTYHTHLHRGWAPATTAMTCTAPCKSGWKPTPTFHTRHQSSGAWSVA